MASSPCAKTDKRRKAGLIPSPDYDTVPDCNNRPSYQLESIARDGRSPSETETWNEFLEHAETQARVPAVQMHLNCITMVSALPISLRCRKKSYLPAMSSAVNPLHTDEIERQWIYETGAALCMNGLDFLTDDEKSRTYQADDLTITTAGGLTSTSTAVMCNVPFLGNRPCHILTDCSPALLMKSDCDHHGVISSYSRDKGPSIALPNGTKVYLDDSRFNVPHLHGYCNSDDTSKSNGKMTETLAMPSTAKLLCSPCGQVPWPGTEARITPTVTPAMAMMFNGDEDTARLAPPPAPHTTLRPTRSRSAQQQGQPLPMQSCDGTTRGLELSEDRKIGDGHRSAISCDLNQCHTSKQWKHRY